MPDEKKPVSDRKPRDTVRAPGPVDPHDTLDDDDDERAVSPRPVAVGPTTPASSTFAQETEPAEGTPADPFIPFHDEETSSRAAEVERPLVELGVGVACLLLAFSVFLSWFDLWPKPGTVFGAGKVSGWASGTWGPAIFFIALAGFTIIVLRRLRVPLAFPFDAPLVVELCGWLCALMLLLKRLLHPTGIRILSGWYIALVLAVLVAGTAGLTSKAASFVLRPGWFASSAGKLGALIVAVALVGGAASGLTVGSGGPSKPVSQGTGNTLIEKGFPKCAKELKFPLPNGVTAVEGFPPAPGHAPICTIVMTSKLSVSVVRARFLTMIAARHWTVSKQRPLPGSISLDGPVCGPITIYGIPKRPVSIVATVSKRCDIFGQHQKGATP